MEYVIALIIAALVVAIAVIALRVMRRRGGVVAAEPVERKGVAR